MLDPVLATSGKAFEEKGRREGAELLRKDGSGEEDQVLEEDGNGGIFCHLILCSYSNWEALHSLPWFCTYPIAGTRATGATVPLPRAREQMPYGVQWWPICCCSSFGCWGSIGLGCQ